MKKLILTILFIVLFTGTATLNAGTFSWEASEGATGYQIHYNEWSNMLGDVLVVDESIMNLTPGVDYLMYVRAYNNRGYSLPSNTLNYAPVEDFIPIDNPKPPDSIIDNPLNLHMNP